MRTIFLVQPEEAETARRIERILLSLSEDAGILFVSVSVVPDPLSNPRKVLYRTIIGCSRSRDPELVTLIAGTYLQREVPEKSQLILEVHRGIDRRGVGA